MGFIQLEKDAPWEHASSLTFEDAKILDLPIKKKWFDMIRSGEKKEEYRAISRHWTSRLVEKIAEYESEFCIHNIGFEAIFKTFDFVRFRNGYRKESPIIYVECRGVDIRTGNHLWGAEMGKEYFVISLGKVIK